MDFKRLPADFLKISTVNLNKSSRGSGPDDLPPNVFNLAPAGRRRDKSHLGICPEYNNDISSL